VARRGKLKGCTIPVADLSPESALETQTQAAAAAALPRNIRWKADQSADARRKNAKRRAKRDERAAETRATPCANNSPTQENAISPYPLDRNQVVEGDLWDRVTDASPQSQSSPSEVDMTDGVIEEVVDLARVPVPVAHGAIQPWIAPLSPQARMLMSHCMYPLFSTRARVSY
jgi:hypothetical protein